MKIIVLDLDYKKELELERQRQLIQKELNQLNQEEARENITIQKKVSILLEENEMGKYHNAKYTLSVFVKLSFSTQKFQHVVG